jgi:S-adenosylmethionine decarboxylase
MYDCPGGLLNDAAFIRDTLRAAAEEARSTLLREVQHSFDPQGVTALALLAESHISVHTWPETGYAAADVFTCGEHTRPEKACEHLVRALQARRFSLRRIERGMRVDAGSFQEQLVTVDPQGESLAEDVEEAFQCRAQSFAQISGSVSTSLPGTSISTA